MLYVYYDNYVNIIYVHIYMETYSEFKIDFQNVDRAILPCVHFQV